MSSEAEQRQPLIIDPESDARRRRTEKSSNEGMWGLVFLIIALAAFVLQSVNGIDQIDCCVKVNSSVECDRK